jgi:putative transcriptional regulator
MKIEHNLFDFHGTSQSWEQGRTRPTGPARALLRIVEKNPKAMLTLHAA